MVGHPQITEQTVATTSYNECEICDYIGSAIINVKEHFLKTHRKNYQLSCWKCEEKYKTIFELRKHVGTFHYTPLTEH